jgi:hypothetical protein
MTRDEVMKLAGEAGYTFADEKSPLLVNHGEWQRRLCERFAALVAGSEREACAKVCEESNAFDWPECAAAIRARGEK